MAIIARYVDAQPGQSAGRLLPKGEGTSIRRPAKIANTEVKP
jgi:hypothetical protein